MKKYLADANIFIRLYIQNVPAQSREVDKYLRQAKEGKISILVISEIIPEVEYVLRKVYKISRAEVADKLLSLIKTTYLEVEKRSEWLEAVSYCYNLNIDLVDVFLWVAARKKDAGILSFDKDFKKLSKIIK